SSTTVPLTGIGGTVIRPLVKIDSLKVGEAEVRNLGGVIIEEATLTEHGLLGGNFLREFWVAIDYTKNLLILDRRVGTGE
ncbi:MAG: aspartyl protease family protein, partial [Nitrososphaerales archaeon]